MILAQSRKGQMEIIGLVIIVILISLGMLFLVRFQLTSESSENQVSSERLPYSTMSSLMKVTITEPDCVPNYPGNQLLGLQEKLITDCAVSVDSPDSSEFKCQGKNSCVFVQERITDLLRQTLASWGKKYTLRSVLIPFQESESKPLFDEINSVGGGCPNGKPREASIFPIRTNAGLVQTTLYVCN